MRWCDGDGEDGVEDNVEDEVEDDGEDDGGDDADGERVGHLSHCTGKHWGAGL